jgi:hypothetical protein
LFHVTDHHVAADQLIESEHEHTSDTRWCTPASNVTPCVINQGNGTRTAKLGDITQPQPLSTMAEAGHRQRPIGIPILRRDGGIEPSMRWRVGAIGLAATSGIDRVHRVGSLTGL